MRRIFLIGYMGAGKTTVGKELSKKMSLSFVDLDHYIEARYHKTVSSLFEEIREEGFRAIEQKMLHEVGTFEDVLISTGGGVPCFYNNMEFMNEVGTTVYLKVSSGELAKRLELVKHTRPILQGKHGEDLRLFVESNLKKRESYYMQANVIFDAEVMLTENDVLAIVTGLERIL